MGSGISANVPDKLDEEACKDLVFEMTGDNYFDHEAFKLLADVSGFVKKQKFIRWTEPLDEVDEKYFKDYLGCEDRIDFLKKFRPVLKNGDDSGLKARLRLKGAFYTINTSESILNEHRKIPEWVELWMEKKGFTTMQLRGACVIANCLTVTPIGEAAKDGDLALCRWLFNHGADPDAHNGNNYNGNTPFLLACFQGHLHICKWLNRDLKMRDVMQPNHDGHSPLMVAAMKGDYFLLEWLYSLHLKKSFNMMRLIRHRDCEGYTAISWAVRNNKEKTCKWLILRGALHDGLVSENSVVENDRGHIDINLVKRDLFPPHPKPPVTSSLRRNLIRWSNQAPYYHSMFIKLVIASFGTFKFFRQKRSYLYLFGTTTYTKKSWSLIAAYAGISYGRQIRDAFELKSALTICEKEYVNLLKKRKNKGLPLISTFPDDTDSSDDDSD
mmetsp:Transcript_52901/g.67842  ORF Transcript_52901/g.67842 Transcript_52901/m.67842 type:complete len:441 (-) Transcript_52901:91-1413(-)